LFRDTNHLNENESKSILDDIEEILKIIGSIQTTIRKKINS